MGGVGLLETDVSVSKRPGIAKCDLVLVVDGRLLVNGVVVVLSVSWFLK